MNHQSPLERFSSYIAKASGSSGAFVGAASLVLVRALTGPLFDYSTNRQLVINTGTTIITFLMVFLIQKSANKDSLALQLKLNELIACNKAASNRVINIETLSEEDLEAIHTFYAHLAKLAQQGRNIHHVYSLDTAENNHSQKQLHHETSHPLI